MSNYSRVRAVIEKANNASYANTQTHVIEVTKQYDEGMVGVEIDATTGPATTFSLAPWTTIYYLAVENLGTTAATYVTLGYTNAAGATLAIKIPISAEGVSCHITPDVTVTGNLVLTSSAGVIPCKISVLGT